MIEHNYSPNNIIKIQSTIRGYLTRNNNKKIKDNFTPDILLKLLDSYVDYAEQIKEINNVLPNKKIRISNFPSEISENIVKFALLKKYNIYPTWNTKTGDLKILNKKIEVKGFCSNGPSSFGPNENWDRLYFVDCRQNINKFFIVYEIKLSNKDDLFRDIQLNKKETYGKIADENKRGKLRGSFYNIFLPQLKNKCEIIFQGKLEELFNI